MERGGLPRTVVVAGGAKGTGLAVAQRFAALGDRVLALGRDPAALEAVGTLGVEAGAATSPTRLRSALCSHRST